MILDTLSTFRTIEGTVYAPAAGLFAVPFRPVNVAPLIVSDGERSVEIERTPATGEGAATFRVRLREKERTREATFRYRPLRTPADSLRRLLTPLADRNPAMQAAARGAFDFPEFLPPVTTARFDDSGRLWIQRRRPACPGATGSPAQVTGTRASRTCACTGVRVRVSVRDP